MKRMILLMILTLLAHADLAEAQQRRGRPDREQRRERMARMRIAPVPEIGVRGAYDFDERDFGLGAQAQLPLGPILRFVPSGEIFFGDETSWQVNADVAARLALLRAGGGVALVDGERTGSADGDSDLGLNLFAGLEAPGWRQGRMLRPFAEARWTFLEDETLFRLVAGVNYPIRSPRR